MQLLLLCALKKKVVCIIDERADRQGNHSNLCFPKNISIAILGVYSSQPVSLSKGICTKTFFLLTEEAYGALHPSAAGICL